ncbi:hypothetical protein SMC26_39990 [Actinomadura fulvescens]|uniref:Lipocalin-like domain-containing protein n=1 Tax=Actinomadura fulvescens TaxID=46160 RepID=A0ABN3QYS6_9ACTN
MAVTVDDLLGCWTLDRVVLRRGGRARKLPGVGWKGLLLYTPDCHVAAVLTVGVGPVRKTVAYAGPFSLAHDQVLHHVTAATLPMRPGRTERRAARLHPEGAGSLMLTAPWGRWALELFWSRAKATTPAHPDAAT